MKEHATLPAALPLSGQHIVGIQMLLWAGEHPPAPTPRFPHFQKEQVTAVPGKVGRARSSFPDHLWEAEGASRQLALCMCILSEIRREYSFLSLWVGQEVFLGTGFKSVPLACFCLGLVLAVTTLFFLWSRVPWGVQSLGTVRALGPGARRMPGSGCVWQRAPGCARSYV